MELKSRCSLKFTCGRLIRFAARGVSVDVPVVNVAVVVAHEQTRELGVDAHFRDARAFFLILIINKKKKVLRLKNKIALYKNTKLTS